MNDPYELIPGRYGITLTRTGKAALEGRIPLEPELCGPGGSLRTASLLMGLDMTAGMASGLGVWPEWSVTADAEIHLVGPCTVGPLRVDAHSIRAGRTLSLVDVRAVDEGHDDRLVAVATANHSVRTPSFEPFMASVPIGKTFACPRPDDGPDVSLEEAFGIKVDGAGRVAAPVDVRTANPWGIFHGGLIGLLVEGAAEQAGVTAPTDIGLRFLRPADKGPLEAAVVETIDRPHGRLARIEMHDRGADRLAVIALVAGK